MGTNLDKMEKLYGKKVCLLSRDNIEQQPDWLVKAKEMDIVFLTGGDTMISTTHVDLRLRAGKIRNRHQRDSWSFHYFSRFRAHRVAELLLWEINKHSPPL